MEQGEWQWARNVYLQGCLIHSTCTMWLNIGLAYMHLEELDNAELALSEANIIDNRNPYVLGYLALLALRTQRINEGEMVNKVSHERVFRCLFAH